MKYLLLIGVLFLGGCAATTSPTPPVNHFIEVPIPFCPAPDTFLLNKEGGFELLNSSSAPGDIAKQWDYELNYWKGRANLLEQQLQFYRDNGKEIETIKQELQSLIKQAKGL